MKRPALYFGSMLVMALGVGSLVSHWDAARLDTEACLVHAVWLAVALYGLVRGCK